MNFEVREDAWQRIKKELGNLFFFQLFFYSIIIANAFGYQVGIIRSVIESAIYMVEWYKWILIGYPLEYLLIFFYSIYPVIILALIIMVMLFSILWIIELIFV